MSIELHCPHCGKLIRAPDDAGGKHGKCPSCKQSVYVPQPPVSDGVIPLAPIDEEDERRTEALREESIRYAAQADKDRAAVEPAGEDGQGNLQSSEGIDVGAPRSEPGEVVDLPSEVQRWIRAMHDSKLDETEQIASRLDKAGIRARDYVESLLLDQMPTQVQDVPAPLARGFLKTLLERLK